MKTKSYALFSLSTCLWILSACQPAPISTILQPPLVVPPTNTPIPTNTPKPTSYPNSSNTNNCSTRCIDRTFGKMSKLLKVDTFDNGNGWDCIRRLESTSFGKLELIGQRVGMA